MPKINWHQTFYSALQIELEDYADIISFEQEHYLTHEAPRIDILLQKKQTECKIQNKIGALFRGHNIIEYKSPNDTLSIDDYYKGFAYANYYKSDSVSVNSIPIFDITISYIINHYPRKLFTHLRKERQIPIVKISKGIYYVYKEMFPIQVIVCHELPVTENTWLHCLTTTLNPITSLPVLINKYQKNKNNPLYKAFMNTIVHVNPSIFEGGNIMCEALQELWADDLKLATEQGVSQGENRLITLINVLLSNNLSNEIPNIASDSDYRNQLYQKYHIV